jgi:hypothetical protein
VTVNAVGEGPGRRIAKPKMASGQMHSFSARSADNSQLPRWPFRAVGSRDGLIEKNPAGPILLLAKIICYPRNHLKKMSFSSSRPSQRGTRARISWRGRQLRLLSILDADWPGTGA